MKYGLIADMHGNLEAFRAVVKSLREEEVENIVLLGDIVGYGASPRECLGLARSLGGTIIAGNHDLAAVELTDINYFNPEAKKAILWTRGELEDEDKEFLRNLKLVHSFSEFTVVHASLKDPEKWSYIFSTHDAKQCFLRLDKKILFVAHSHVPLIFEEKEEGCSFYLKEMLALEKESKYIVNVGSVGQPRDGNPKACFVVYDTQEQTIQYKRTEYDIGEAMLKITEAGLPDKFAGRLNRGE